MHGWGSRKKVHRAAPQPCLIPSSCGGIDDKSHASSSSSLTPQLLVKEPAQRLELAKVAEHPWIKANADPAVLAAKY